MAEGGKPKLEDWADLLDDDLDFATEFNRLIDNDDVDGGLAFQTGCAAPLPRSLQNAAAAVLHCSVLQRSAAICNYVLMVLLYVR